MSMITSDQYFEKLYAGWLGKLIGIRAGAPIEGWTYERIKSTFGELDGYPAAYKNFAADDDSNGPMFFIRAIEDCRDLSRFSANDIAGALMNYAPYEHGFFWWGGYGISTEHTAYLNLMSGIPAPRSGSIEQNGATVAEQIGGQIFIDPWGLISPGNPKQAAELASKAASVTHGGNGVYGGVYIATCISLAFVEESIRSILTKALDYIPADSEYARVVKAVMAYYDSHPDNWRDCYRYIFENFGYDKYPGNCHIIPNTAVMILALLYGREDFTDTINICNMCGWDTDCNAGNVGCIIGTFCGLDGMDYEKWLAPINDLLVCSSVIPSLNIMDAPYCASYFAKMSCLLSGQMPPEPWKEILERLIDSCHFEYPGSTHAIRYRSEQTCSIENTDEEARSGRRSLKITVAPSSDGARAFIYKQTHYRAEDFSDSRYDPAFSPLVYPGQTVRLSVLPIESDAPYTVSIYAKNGKTGDVFMGKEASVNATWQDLSLDIPGGQDGYISETGLMIRTDSSFESDITVYLDDLEFGGKPDYIMDFSADSTEQWNGLHSEVDQFSRFKGLAYLEENRLHLTCADRGEVYTGHHNWSDYRFACQIEPLTGYHHYVNLRVGGAMRSYALGFHGEGKVALLKNHFGYKVLYETDYPWEPKQRYEFEASAAGNLLELKINGESVIHYEDTDEPYQKGLVGMAVMEGSHCAYAGALVR